MKAPITNATLQQERWFKTWFDSVYYHKLYQNRNEQEAASFIETLLDYLQPAPGSRMLDLACGTGRHSKHLAQRGFDVTGLDLSYFSIRRAKKRETALLQFWQHDMRRPFGTSRYDYIFNFFTSFGYFDTERDNITVLGNIARALKSGGYLLIDYLNVPYTERKLVPVEEKEIDGTLYHINRWSNDAFIYKRIAVQDKNLAQPMEQVEKVARFSVADFERFFAAQQLRMIAVFGDYDLSAYQPEHSKRMILLARK